MRSAAQINASKINGARSRGPVTEEGKARASRNALLKDGVRSRTLILPGESAAEFEMELEQAIDDFQPRDGTEHGLVHDIVSARWMHFRAQRAQFERLKTQIKAAGDREDQDVAGTLEKLFSDAGRPHALYAISSTACGEPRTSSTENVADCDKPPALVKRLEGTAKGCQALIDRWREIADRVESNLEIQPHDRLRLIRMLGKQPLAAAVDQQVWLIYVACFGLYPAGKQEPFEDLKTDVGTTELPAFLPRVRSRWGLLLDSSNTAGCRQTLLDLVARNVERLEAIRAEHLELADEIEAGTAARLAYEESPQGERLARYELASQRRAHRCEDAFWKHRREKDRTEDGGRRAEDRTEDRGRRAEDGATKVTDLGRESGVAEGVSSAPEKKLTSEPELDVRASEAAELKEVAACNEELIRGLAELARLHDLGIGAPGTRVGGDRKGRAAIEDMISSGGPLMRPIS